MMWAAIPPDFVYAWSDTGMFLFVLAATGALALALHLLLNCRRMAGFVPPDLSPVMQTLCGTLFVLSVTFLANAVWKTEAEARELVYAEARSLRTIRSYMDAMTGPSHDAMVKMLGDYAAATAAEWPDMADKGASPVAEERLADIYRAAIRGFTEGEANRTLQQRILAALDALSQARQARLTMASEQVTAGQWFEVVFLGLLLLVTIAACHARAPRARAVALTLITGAISVAVFVILAHDRPFIGNLALTPQPILEAVK